MNSYKKYNTEVIRLAKERAKLDTEASPFGFSFLGSNYEVHWGCSREAIFYLDIHLVSRTDGHLIHKHQVKVA